MALFRKRLTPEQAFEAVLAAISNWPAPPSDLPVELAEAGGEKRIRYEQAYLSLFAALIAVKFCKQRDWRDNGYELFVALSARVTQRLFADRGNAAAPVGERMKLYDLALAATEPHTERAAIAREVAKDFAVVLGARESTQIQSLGAQTFLDAFDRVAAVTNSFKL